MVICYMEILLKILALYRVSIRSGKSEKVRKFVRGSEKVRELDKSGKSQGRKVLTIFRFLTSICMWKCIAIKNMW